MASFASHLISRSLFGLGVICALGVLAMLLFPKVSSGTPASWAQSKLDVVQISTAVMGFETEYGHLPGTGSGPVEGEILSLLTGNNSTINPLNIVFIEIEPARKGQGGLSDGAFVDPWGGKYQIAFDSDNDGTVLAGTNSVPVKKHVAVWNDPALSTNTAWFQSKKGKPHYVTSWE